MSQKAHGQIRRSQVITTWGPGALLDLPNYAVIVGGLETWPREDKLDPISEPRLVRKLRFITGVAAPRLYAPPADTNDPSQPNIGIGVWRFPEWFVVQERSNTQKKERSRRLVHRKSLDSRSRFDGHSVVPTRFVRACVRGHLDDLDWQYFVHGTGDHCKRQLWLDERGTSGDLGDLSVRCECGKKRSMYDAAIQDAGLLGPCRGARPWLGKYANEPCGLPSRLLIRTAANAYFPQVVSVLSIPERISTIHSILEKYWDDLQIVDDVTSLAVIKKKPVIAAALQSINDRELLEAIEQYKKGGMEERPVKQVELEAILAAQEGYGDDIPIDPDFHARRLSDHVWRHNNQVVGIESVIQLHRLREVLALTGFSRFEAIVPDIHGEYETDVQCAALAEEPAWFPAVENRGEGLFIQLNSKAIEEWQKRPEVAERLTQLEAGHGRWAEKRKSKRLFPGGPYILLHTLSHLLIQSVSMRCGYPASSIRERIYVEPAGYGILLYTASPDAEGTLGGLVQQARHIEGHLLSALQTGGLCSNDPICAQHTPVASMENRWLNGAACHACTLIAETSCEMRNDYLDRALVIPTLDTPDAAFFTSVQ